MFIFKMGCIGFRTSLFREKECAPKTGEACDQELFAMPSFHYFCTAFPPFPFIYAIYPEDAWAGGKSLVLQQKPKKGKKSDARHGWIMSGKLRKTSVLSPISLLTICVFKTSFSLLLAFVGSFLFLRVPYPPLIYTSFLRNGGDFLLLHS
jgi:hypothetical protein